MTSKTNASAEARTLAQQQEWFCRSVTAPEGTETVTAEEAARVLKPSRQLNSAMRLQIYRHAYRARLVECLADDYAGVARGLGERAFEDVCQGYIEEHPSGSPSLNHFGRHFSAFCRTRTFAGAAFFADLAALEWAIVEAIHAPASEPLTAADIAAIDADAWHGVKLLANPSLRVLELRYPTNDYLSSIKDGSPAPVPSAAPEFIAVYRSKFGIRRVTLEAELARLVQQLAGGTCLGPALEQLASGLGHLDEAAASTRIAGWFQQATASGLFCGVST
jgi:hypothetical protein